MKLRCKCCGRLVTKDDEWETVAKVITQDVGKVRWPIFQYGQFLGHGPFEFKILKPHDPERFKDWEKIALSAVRVNL